MHKRCVLYSSDAVPDNASASPPSEVTDWDLCIICQNPSKEKLQCPAASKRGDCGAGYRSFADVVGSFPNAEPMVSRLDEGNGILAALTAHSAKWGHCKRYRAAQGHRAGVNADLTPSTGGPVGHACR